MGEEDDLGGGGGDEEEEDQQVVMEWEAGLPSADGDLTSLSQSLIPPELALAFSISPEPCRSMLDVNRASQNTLSSLCRRQSSLQPPFSSSKHYLLKSPLPSFAAEEEEPEPEDPLVFVEGDKNEPDQSTTCKDGFDDARKVRRLDSVEEAEKDSSALRTTTDINSNNYNSEDDDHTTTTIAHHRNRTSSLKRSRLVWTPQLHRRFVDVVAHLGIKNAVPKTIMQLMNVEGLTRENVASHLQKYRLYLKRMQAGLSDEGPSSSSDHLFASTPAVLLQSFHESGANVHHMPLQMPYPPGPNLLPMPVLSVASHGHGNMGMMPVVGNPPAPPVTYHGGFQSQHPYNMFREQQQRDWSGNNKFGSFIMSYPHHVNSNDP